MTERVVTLPPRVTGEAASAFAARARAAGGAVLEVRTDLHDPDAVDATKVASQLPLLVAERGRRAPDAWRRAARWVDCERGLGRGQIVSFHALEPLSTEQALAGWGDVGDALVKHVEPLGSPSQAARLFDTQRRLEQRFGAGRVTVLATGPLALPFRALLAERNALDYLALDAEWSSAPGQRLLADAVRAGPGQARRGILGTDISHSRSPRTHAPPFDRIDLPEDAPLADLLTALHPHYAGFAVTSPFKKLVARLVGAPGAINTLIRRPSPVCWEGANTDVDGARAVLARLGAGEVTVLGDGGATVALRLTGRPLRVLRRAEVTAEPLAGTCLWTWPSRVEGPPALRFQDGARVAVIAYGEPGRHVAQSIRERGGRPVLLGATWFVAQARGQRRLWETAS